MYAIVAMEDIMFEQEVENKDRVFEWRKSPPHLVLLGTFAKPRPLNRTPFDIDMEQFLGEPLDHAVERFIVHGVLKSYELNERILKDKIVSELKTILKTYNLPISGNKAILIERLIKANIKMGHCTSYGLGIIKESLQEPEWLLKKTPQTKKHSIKTMLLWLLKEGIILGVAGNLAHDGLKKLLEDERVSSAVESTLPTPTNLPTSTPTSTIFSISPVTPTVTPLPTNIIIPTSTPTPHLGKLNWTETHNIIDTAYDREPKVSIFADIFEFVEDIFGALLDVS